MIKKMLMTLVVVVAVLVMIRVGTVKANGGFHTVNGKWGGTAFASVIDLNSDGVKARTFDVHAFGQIPFVSLEGVADTGLVALPGQGSCTNPNAIELQAFGKFTFRAGFDFGGDALFAEVDPTAPHLCFDAANPDETLVIRIAGGTGRYANATGTGVLHLHDIVRVTAPAVLSGIPIDAPVMVDTRGEFSLTIQ